MANTEAPIYFNPKPEALSFKEEFHCHRFSLNHERPQDFLCSQWQSKSKSLAFLIYRWLVAGFFVTGVISCIYFYFWRGSWFIYLTNWGFVMCGITSAYSAILITFHHFTSDLWIPPSIVIKLFWACYWITIVVELTIGIIYWAAIFPFREAHHHDMDVLSGVFCVWTHVLPTIAFTFDNLLTALPARFLHFIYPIGFCIIYTVFTIMYFFLGGLDAYGRPYIYLILDYDKPLRAAASIILSYILVILLSSLQYGVYRLRICWARKYFNSR
ncbi:protein rolling stone-like isoform X1 [Drosophila bipectinata]|uniref:protein rolling stone-like isoform X1 n=1 Tax=Drosophila bipectinata TaxID=42026 RepID=UPI0038B34D5E